MSGLSIGGPRRYVAGAASVVAVITIAMGGCSGSSHGPSKSVAAGSPTSSRLTPTTRGNPSSSHAPTSTVSGHPSATAAPVESNPPGDIPDGVAYVGYANPAGRYRFVHPAGWASTVRGASVTFTDKLNGITAGPRSGGAVPTPGTVRAGELPGLRASQPAFELRSMKAVTLPAGRGVLMVYRRNSAPNAVTGRVYRDEVQRYEIVAHGHGISLELYGAVGSDNVDPYTKISQSLRLL